MAIVAKFAQLHLHSLVRLISVDQVKKIKCCSCWLSCNEISLLYVTNSGGRDISKNGKSGCFKNQIRYVTTHSYFQSERKHVDPHNM